MTEEATVWLVRVVTFAAVVIAIYFAARGEVHDLVVEIILGLALVCIQGGWIIVAQRGGGVRARAGGYFTGVGLFVAGILALPALSNAWVAVSAMGFCIVAGHVVLEAFVRDVVGPKTPLRQHSPVSSSTQTVLPQHAPQSEGDKKAEEGDSSPSKQGADQQSGGS